MGYIAFEEDLNTIKGVADHQGETAGLGAEITQAGSRSFCWRKIFNAEKILG